MDELQDTFRTNSSLAVAGVDDLVENGLIKARQPGFRSVVEVSDRSESAYLHIRRGTTWYGFRVACHEPFYPCAADYMQMIIPRNVTALDLDHYRAYFRQSITHGGKVVADPAEVEAMIAMETDRRQLASKAHRLSALARCEIRHRLNRIAHWTWELQNVASSNER